MPLAYVGKQDDTVSVDTIATKSFVESVMVDQLSASQVDAAINNTYNPFADKAYADSRDALLVTQQYCRDQDLLRVPLLLKDVNGGVPSLSATRRIAGGRINRGSTQRFPKGFWTPPAYNASDVTTISGETALYPPFTISDPGFAYRLLVFGVVDGKSHSDGVYPQIVVRTGSTVGEIIARGNGLAESYGTNTGNPTDGFEYTANELSAPDWALDNGPGSTAGAGTIAADGHAAYFRQINTSTIFRRARRVNPADAITPADYQEINAQLATVQVGANAYNEFFFRWNTGDPSYVKCRIHQSTVEFNYNVGFGESSVQASYASLIQQPGDVWTIIAGADGDTNKHDFRLNGSSLFTWDGKGDFFTNPAVGSGNRSWGFGMGNSGTGSAAAHLASVTMNEGPQAGNSSSVEVIPAGFDTQSVKTGPCQVYVRALRVGGTSTVDVTNDFPTLYAMAIPA